MKYIYIVGRWNGYYGQGSYTPKRCFNSKTKAEKFISEQGLRIQDEFKIFKKQVH